MDRLFKTVKGAVTFICVLFMVGLAYVALQVALFVGPVVFIAWVIFMSIWHDEPLE